MVKVENEKQPITMILTQQEKRRDVKTKCQGIFSLPNSGTQSDGKYYIATHPDTRYNP